MACAVSQVSCVDVEVSNTFLFNRGLIEKPKPIKDVEKWGHSGYKTIQKWGQRQRGHTDDEKWGHSGWQRKCNGFEASPNFYVPKRPNPTDGKKKQFVTTDTKGVLQQYSPRINKYWAQRFQLFSKFSHGIRMDEEGWYSVTPEAIAKHQAIRSRDGNIVVDLFTGAGGNAIQFAKQGKQVTAIDIDANKVDYARHNATIYGVQDRINFINADCLALAPTLKADIVFMSPPWGGPEYSKVDKFDIHTMLKPCSAQSLFDIGKEIGPKIVMFLPKNTHNDQLTKIASSVVPAWSLEIENNYINGRLKGITAYFTKSSEM